MTNIEAAKTLEQKSIDHRNLIDEYKNKMHAEIMAIHDAKRLPFGTFCYNINHDLNIGNIIRTHNAFCGSRVFIYGEKHWDRRASVGTHLYEHLRYLKTGCDILQEIESFTPVAIENNVSSVDLDKFVWPAKPVLMFGNEETGIPDEVRKICVASVRIPQLGTVRSLNVASAAAIAIYDFVRRTH